MMSEIHQANKWEGYSGKRLSQQENRHVKKGQLFPGAVYKKLGICKVQSDARRCC